MPGQRWPRLLGQRSDSLARPVTAGESADVWWNARGRARVASSRLVIKSEAVLRKAWFTPPVSPETSTNKGIRDHCCQAEGCFYGPHNHHRNINKHRNSSSHHTSECSKQSHWSRCPHPSFTPNQTLRIMCSQLCLKLFKMQFAAVMPPDTFKHHQIEVY